MEELLTEDELKYLRMISRYLLSSGIKTSYIEIEANEWDNQTEIQDIDWEYVTHFDWNQRVEIPARFIQILQKIFNYINESGKYEYPDIDGLNWNRFLIIIDPENNVLTISNQYGYYSEGGEGEIEFEEPELMEEWKDQLEINGVQIPEDGVLSVYYSGGGDEGALEGVFSENNRPVPADMEDFCYNELSNNYSGWENNEGGQGRFEFNFNKGTIFLYHTENVEVTEGDTLFEIKY